MTFGGPTTGLFGFVSRLRVGVALQGTETEGCCCAKWTALRETHMPLGTGLRPSWMDK